MRTLDPLLPVQFLHSSRSRPYSITSLTRNSTYYDTISHNGQILLNLVLQMDADRVMLGDDFPADMGYERPVEVAERAPELSLSERELILGGNAARLLKL